jgi:O-antigen ligase
MSISYVALAILVLFKPNLWQQIKQACSNPYIIGSLCFYAVFILSILWTTAPFDDVWKMLVRIIGYLLAPLLLIAFQTNSNGKLLLRGFIIGALVTAILSIISWVFNRHVLYGIHDNSWVIFHGHILHNAFLAIASCFMLWIATSTNISKTKQILSIIAYLILVSDILFIVNGRTGQVILLVINCFLLLYRFKIKGLIITLAGLIVILPLLYISPVIQKGINNYNEDMKLYKKGDTNTSMGARLAFHQVSKFAIKENLLLGTGTGSFNTTYKKYATLLNNPAKTTNPHSDMLWIGVETGLIGMATFIIMLCLAVISVFKLLDFYRCMGLCLILGYLCAMLQNSFFIDNVTGMAFIFILLGIITSGNKNSIYHSDRIIG